MNSLKSTVVFTSIICFFCFAKCNKDKIDSKGLPPATQEGKNTLGFLLNGQIWKPQGTRVAANLSIDYDPNFNNGIFSIVAYNFLTPVSEQFIIGVRDSLNFMNAPFEVSLNNTSLYSISYNTPCDYFNQLNEVQSSGRLTVSKLDRANRIISGTFTATLSRAGCITLQITEGRFDMKF